MSLGLAKLSLNISAPSSAPVDLNSQLSRPTEEMTPSLEKCKSVYESFCEKNKYDARADLENTCFATISNTKLSIHDANNDGEIIVQRRLHPCEHDFTITSFTTIEDKCYIVVHLELLRDVDGFEPNYDVYCYDLKNKTVNLVIKKTADPILTKDRIISSGTGSAYQGYVRIYKYDGTMQAHIRITDLWDRIVTSASDDFIYVKNYWSQWSPQIRDQFIQFTMDGKLSSISPPYNSKYAKYISWIPVSKK